jgi:hypothetical protein
MATRIEVTHKDTMAFWNDDLGAFLHDPNGHASASTFLYEVPDAWVAGGTLTPDAFERIYAHLYGATWKSGNGDGSQYVVLESTAKVVGAGDPRTFVPIG